MRKKKELQKSKVMKNENNNRQQFAALLEESGNAESRKLNPDALELPVTQMIPSEMPEESDPVVNVGLASHIGTRSSQQDSAIVGIGNFVAPEFAGKFIAVVCDGMGGLQGGELASALCVKTFYEDFFSNPGIKSYADFLKSEIDKIDEKIARLKDSNGEPLKAGSTFVSIIFDNGKLHWACVGDSHLYIVRGSEIVQVNRDHNYFLILKEQVKNGEITEEAAASHKKKEALISYMGMNGIQYSDINEKPFPLLPGDSIILCSDGLYRLVSNEEMLDILNLYPLNMNRAAHAMVEAACDKMDPHQDNTSVIIFKYM